MSGFERLIGGIVRRHASDAARVERGAAVLDDLYEAFGGGRSPRPPRSARARR